MEEDLRSMICADGLALARSTLVSLTGFHSKAKRIYGPIECNSQLNHLAVHRPEVQVLLISYAPPQSRRFLVYRVFKELLLYVYLWTCIFGDMFHAACAHYVVHI